LAMVGPLAAIVPEYVRGDFGDLTGISIVPGACPSKRCGSCRHGRIGQHRECLGEGVLGVGIRFDHQTRNLCSHVSGTGSTLLVPSQRQLRCCADARHLCHPYVLRGRIRHYAGVRCRLLWLKKCGPNLRTHANCMGLCERIWPAADCLYAPGERNVWRTPPCDRRSDGSFRHASVDSIPTPPDRGSSQVYSTSTAPGNVNLVCASLTNLAARLPTCGFPSPTAATTSVCTAAAEMRVRFTETCLFPIPAHSSALRQCGNQEGPDYRWGATVAQGRHRVRTGVVAAAHCG
jgi:hypothetical protein